MISINKNHFQSFHSLPILNTFSIKWVSFTRLSSSSTSFLFSWKKVSEKTWLMLKKETKKAFYDLRKDTHSMQWVSIRSGQLDKPSSEIIINFYINATECCCTQDTITLAAILIYLSNYTKRTLQSKHCSWCTLLYDVILSFTLNRSCIMMENVPFNESVMTESPLVLYWRCRKIS